MTKINLPKKLTGGNFFYGWIIVIICAISGFFSGPGQTFGISVFIDPLIEYLGMSRSTISSYYSAGTLLAGILVVFISRQIDIIGHRKAMTLISIIFGGVCLFMSFITQNWMLFTGFFLMRLFGQSSMTIGPSTLIPHWFSEKRGKALSLMSLGQIMAAFLLPVLNIYLIKIYGWQNTWRFWGLTIWIIMVPLACFFIRNKPADIGLLPDGKQIASTTDNGETKNNGSDAVLEIPSKTLIEACKTFSFWVLLLCIFVPSMVSTGITFHIVSVFASKGYSAQVAATVLSIQAIVSIPSALLAGIVLDKIKIRNVINILFIFYSFSLIWLFLSSNLLQAIIYGVLAGIMMGFNQVIINITWPVYFGLNHLGSIRGIVQMALVIGSAFGPLPFGFAYNIFNGYQEIIIATILIAIITAILTFFIAPQPEKTKILQ